MFEQNDEIHHVLLILYTFLAKHLQCIKKQPALQDELMTGRCMIHKITKIKFYYSKVNT